MAQLKVPESPREYATHYTTLLGVDFQADQTQVDKRRSPYMVNMISDFGGNPVKRDGYRKVGIAYAALVMVDGVMYGTYATNSAFYVATLELNGYDFTTIGTPIPYSKNVGTIKSTFVYQNKIYTIATNAFLCYDTETSTISAVGVGANMMSLGTVGENAPAYEDNIPLTIIGMKPDGTDSLAYEDKNLFSIYQQVSYIADGTSTYTIPIYKKIGTWVRVEVRNNDGDWVPLNTGVSLGTATTLKGKKLDGTGFEDCDVVDPTITITPAPQAPTDYGLPNEDNVRITFAPFSMEVAEAGTPTNYVGYYNEEFLNILSSPTATFQNNRMFVADKYKIHYSEVSDPFTISDLSWFEVESEIVCFTRSNNYLVAITKDNGGNTIFLASEMSRVIDSQTGDTESYFTCRASNAGIGAIASKCVATLCDEPMFLSDTGLFGLLTNWQSEKYAINRSSRVNRRLCKEPDLDNAVGIVHNDYFYLAINSRMYVFDGRHKESDKAGNKPLEAYYFEGMPDIKNMYVVGDRMYFCDSSGTYTWNDDLTDLERYYDDAYLKEATSVLYQIGYIQDPVTGEYYVPPTGEWDVSKPTPDPDAGEILWYKATYDDGSVEETYEEVDVGDKKLTGDAVCAEWRSVFDDDNLPQKLKTLMKKGSMVTLVPYYRSGCEITLVKDGDRYEYLGSFDSDLQSFERIDFNRFTFSTNDVAIDNFTKKKIKKYKRLQIQVANNKPEPFGLTQITKTFTVGNYAKR